MKAAADTLEAIRRARESDTGHPKPPPPRADLHGTSPAMAMPADAIRKQHDEAFQVLQGH